MGEQQVPKIEIIHPEVEIIHPEVEILPRQDFEASSSSPGSRVWLSVDSQGGTRRVYTGRPGPFAAFFMVLAFGVIVALSFLLATVLLAVSAIAVTGLVIYALFRGALQQLK